MSKAISTATRWVGGFLAGAPGDTAHALQYHTATVRGAAWRSG